MSDQIQSKNIFDKLLSARNSQCTEYSSHFSDGNIDLTEELDSIGREVTLLKQHINIKVHKDLHSSEISQESSPKDYSSIKTNQPENENMPINQSTKPGISDFESTLPNKNPNSELNFEKKHIVYSSMGGNPDDMDNTKNNHHHDADDDDGDADADDDDGDADADEGDNIYNQHHKVKPSTINNDNQSVSHVPSHHKDGLEHDNSSENAYVVYSKNNKLTNWGKTKKSNNNNNNSEERKKQQQGEDNRLKNVIIDMNLIRQKLGMNKMLENVKYPNMSSLWNNHNKYEEVTSKSERIFWKNYHMQSSNDEINIINYKNNDDDNEYRSNQSTQKKNLSVIFSTNESVESSFCLTKNEYWQIYSTLRNELSKNKSMQTLLNQENDLNAQENEPSARENECGGDGDRIFAGQENEGELNNSPKKLVNSENILQSTTSISHDNPIFNTSNKEIHLDTNHDSNTKPLNDQNQESSNNTEQITKPSEENIGLLLKRNLSYPKLNKTDTQSNENHHDNTAEHLSAPITTNTQTAITTKKTNPMDSIPVTNAKADEGLTSGKLIPKNENGKNEQSASQKSLENSSQVNQQQNEQGDKAMPVQENHIAKIQELQEKLVLSETKNKNLTQSNEILVKTLSLCEKEIDKLAAYNTSLSAKLQSYEIETERLKNRENELIKMNQSLTQELEKLNHDYMIKISELRGQNDRMMECEKAIKNLNNYVSTCEESFLNINQTLKKVISKSNDYIDPLLNHIIQETTRFIKHLDKSYTSLYSETPSISRVTNQTPSILPLPIMTSSSENLNNEYKVKKNLKYTPIGNQYETESHIQKANVGFEYNDQNRNNKSSMHSIIEPEHDIPTYQGLIKESRQHNSDQIDDNISDKIRYTCPSDNNNNTNVNILNNKKKKAGNIDKETLDGYNNLNKLDIMTRNSSSNMNIQVLNQSTLSNNSNTITNTTTTNNNSTNTRKIKAENAEKIKEQLRKKVLENLKNNKNIFE